ncbi:MAG: DUF1080 domain-containing protein [Planctomycetota bacterium]|nr:DUF1080 domain-containing protein [Planctomycetota bacterium]
MSKHWGLWAMAGLAIVAFGNGPALLAADAEAGFECIFDGKTLQGWEGKTEFWSVQDGLLTGRTTKEQPTKGNTFLIWRGGQPADFELRLKWRFGDEAFGNSGVQYRSVDRGNSVVNGYQADMDLGHSYTGILYEEGGRGILARRCVKTIVKEDGKTENAGPTCDEKELLASIKKGEWNEWVISAKGNQLLQQLNGFTTVDVTDNQVAKRRMEGIIALQLHAGPPMVVQFKDIRIKQLK